MKRMALLIALVAALFVGSSGTWALKAHASRTPVICGGACDGGGYVCGPNNLGSTDAYGHGYCHVVYLPSWPWVGYSYY